MTSPAMCTMSYPFDGWESCDVRYVTPIKKCVGYFGNITGVATPEWSTQEERFDSLADAFVGHVESGDFVLIEGYAFGAKGQVFNIGECGGVLKHKLWSMGVEFDVVPPTVLKKFATGKGNSDKKAMNDAFVLETGFDVRAALGMSDKQWNPSSDVVDAYYLCRMAKTSRDG
jgi:hypothetical protein